ncbi:MAG: alanine racemase [Cryomorphaceae bacterium]|nr:alanine racemase [Cryomorphaceae bacterium]
MNLQLSYDELAHLTGATINGSINAVGRIARVAIDSRSIHQGSETVFFALKGNFRDGHRFIPEAHEKGVRAFFVENNTFVDSYPDSVFFSVRDVLFALQELAAAHRRKFTYPVIAITGSAGKTTVKEWLNHLLSPELHIIRSPKSYNSQLGVALSLLEMSSEHALGIFEAGISQPEEMERLAYMIQPTHGIFTSLGRSHEENFKSKEQQLEEKLKLFAHCTKTLVNETVPVSQSQLSGIHGELVSMLSGKDVEHLNIPFTDRISVMNARMAFAAACLFTRDRSLLKLKVEELERPAMRLETFDGIKGCTVINDTYNLDPDALQYALEYQLQLSNNRKRIVILGIDDANKGLRQEAERVIQRFEPDQFYIVGPEDQIDVEPSNAVILLKGTRNSAMQRRALQFRLKKHKTYLEINLSAVRNNLMVYKGLLTPETRLLVMVKAQSYGSGAEKLARFLELQGIHYLGVAYADEGIELREQGIKLPILVMNAEEESFEECIRYNLEPAIYSLHQLDLFVKELIMQNRSDYPIHLKIETGMKRLGFELSELPEVISLLQAQPEVRVASVYSHLADSDNRRDKRFTQNQLTRFEQACAYLEKQLNQAFSKHILNSEGVANYSDSAYDMVRLGIGLFGISGNPLVKKELLPVLGWYSAISQVKTVKKGESAGYSRSFLAEKDIRIAIVPVGYADGFRRELSNGKGSVFIQGKPCPVIGRVCMDMILVDIGKLEVKEGDTVEILGPNQSLENLADCMGTIPYEVMTGISRRVHRIYTEN